MAVEWKMSGRTTWPEEVVVIRPGQAWPQVAGHLLTGGGGQASWHLLLHPQALLHLQCLGRGGGVEGGGGGREGGRLHGAAHHTLPRAPVEHGLEQELDPPGPRVVTLTSSQAWTTSSTGSPSRRTCRRQELKFAASGWMYLPPSARR